MNRRSVIYFSLAAVLLIAIGVAIGICIGHFVVPKPETEIQVESLTVLTEQDVDVMYQSLKALDSIFRKHNITYFLTAGTLLGALRNFPPGILRWDDDIDIGIPHAEEPKLLRLFESQEWKNNWFNSDFFFGYKVSPADESKFVKVARGFIDIFVYEERKDCRNRKNPKARYFIRGDGCKTWPGESFQTLEEMQVTDCQFYDFHASCVKDSVKFIKSSFGKNALTTAKVWNHKSKTHGYVFAYKNVNEGWTLPLLSKNLVSRLDFRKSAIKQIPEN